MIFLYRFSVFFALLALSACGGSTSDNTLYGARLAPAPAGTIVSFLGVRSDYSITKAGDNYEVKNLDDGMVTTVSELNFLKFNDVTVNLAIITKAQKIKSSDLDNLLELYVAFFNRVPDADGLSYWIEQTQNGVSMDQIANSFYQAAIQYSSLTGYSNSMSSNDFVRVIYKNVLGRFDNTAPPQADVMYWAGSLENHSISKGQLVRTMLDAAHSFKGDETWGWVPQLLDNKIKVAYYFSVEQGINYNSAEDSIRKGMSIAAAITSSDIETAKALIGLTRGPANSDKFWRPSNVLLPATGNYVYLQSDRDDYVGGGSTYLYTNTNAILALQNDTRLINIRITGNQGWDGYFHVPNSANKDLVGFYEDLTRLGFGDPTKGGLEWTGEGRGCNTLKGSFSIDKIEMIAGVIVALDMRFEQHCEGRANALHGAIHWEAKDSSAGPAGPINPVPDILWQPPAGVTPASGNYVYLQSDSGDYIGQGRNYSYTDLNSILRIRPESNRLNVDIEGDQNWSGDFVTMNSINQLQVGYYSNLMRYGFHNPVMGGFDWDGEGRGCNKLIAWFAIDKISYSAGIMQSLEARFEQHCEGSSAAFRGKIHWNRDDVSVAPGPVWPIPNTVWKPLPGMTPTSGNYVYLQSDTGDYVGSGKTYTYTPSNAKLSIDVDNNTIKIQIDGNWNANWTGHDYWSGSFQSMSSLEILKPGYYSDLMRYPFHNPAKGGLDLGGNGKGCNKLSGWFAIDKITWTSGVVTELDLRFMQYCDGRTSALRGQLHWTKY